MQLQTIRGIDPLLLSEQNYVKTAKRGVHSSGAIYSNELYNVEEKNYDQIYGKAD
jgi:hypothetical protein